MKQNKVKKNKIEQISEYEKKSKIKIFIESIAI